MKKLNLPTKITVARLILIPFFVACYLVSFPYHELGATGLFIIASVTDWLDGHLARKYNQVTTLGKFLDPVADKLLVCSALVLVCVIDNAFSIPVIVASIIIISRELVITCFRTIAATKNVIMAADKLGKIKTATQLFGLSFYLPYRTFAELSTVLGEVLMYAGFVLLMVATFFTVLSAVNYIVENRGVLSDD